MERLDIETAAGVDVEAATTTLDTVGARAAKSSSSSLSPPTGSFSLYQEALQAFLFSNLILCLPPLRDWGRDGVLRGDTDRLERLEHLPFTGADLCTVFQDNQELFTKEGGLLQDEDRLNLYHRALGLETAENTSRIMFGEYTYHEILHDLQFVALSDHRQQTDIVYMVVVSHLLRQVSVIFRGTTTTKDYKQDMKVLLAAIANPIDAKHDYAKREDELGIHLGFREYLYSEESITKALYKPRIYKDFVALVAALSGDEKNEEAKKRAADQIAAEHPRAAGLARKGNTRDLKRSLELPCKYQLILEQVLDVVDEHNDYRLFCTGHSLGGAMVVTLAFEAAADERVPAPVTCVTSGAPKVGSTAYLRAFTYLERQGRLRCAQISNNRDIIPKFPINGTLNPCAAACWSNFTFRHVGLHVVFCDKSKYIVRIPPPHEHFLGMLVHDIVRLFRFWGVLAALVGSGLVCISVATPCLCICFWPACAYCALHHGKGVGVHHSQKKYMARLEKCREDLEQRTIEELYDRRWARPRYKAPVIHQHKGKN